VTDSIVNYFVFELKGFEFLLNSIGTNLGNVQAKHLNAGEVKTENEEKKSNPEEEPQAKQSLVGSDLLSLLNIGDSKKENDFNMMSTTPSLTIPAPGSSSTGITSSNSVNDEDVDESSFNMRLEEFGKTMECIEESFENNPKQWGKTDWSVNKKAYKHRVMYKLYKDNDCFEHHMVFKLPTPAELREI